jgi:hypothetical protein
VAVTGGVACVGVAGLLPMDWLEGCGQLRPVASKDVAWHLQGCVIFFEVGGASSLGSTVGGSLA